MFSNLRSLLFQCTIRNFYLLMYISLILSLSLFFSIVSLSRGARVISLHCHFPYFFVNCLFYLCIESLNSLLVTRGESESSNVFTSISSLNSPHHGLVAFCEHSVSVGFGKLESQVQKPPSLLEKVHPYDSISLEPLMVPKSVLVSVL